MKKLLIAIALLAIFLVPAMAFAEETNNTTINTNETEDLPNPGTTPDSGFYGLDVALDNLRLRMAMAGETRARIGLQIAEERLSEVQAMAQERKQAAFERAEQERERIMSQVQEEVQNAKQGNFTGIELGVQNHIKAMEQVKARIVNNVNIPDDVKQQLQQRLQTGIQSAEQLQLRVQERVQQRLGQESNQTGQGNGTGVQTQEQTQEQTQQQQNQTQGNGPNA